MIIFEEWTNNCVPVANDTRERRQIRCFVSERRKIGAGNSVRGMPLDRTRANGTTAASQSAGSTWSLGPAAGNPAYVAL